MVTQKESLDTLFRERGPDPWGYGTPHVQQRLEKSIAFISQHVPSGFSGEFVELGAFNGVFSRYLRDYFPAASLTVNDVADTAIEQARRNLAGMPNTRIVQADLADMTPATSSTDRIVLLLECLYYRAHEERETVLHRLINAFQRPPIFISGPITGGPYFTEPGLIEQFTNTDYDFVDCAALTVRSGDPVKMCGTAKRATGLRIESANQVCYYFQPHRQGWFSNPFARLRRPR